jgi:hypothetical protein
MAAKKKGKKKSPAKKAKTRGATPKKARQRKAAARATSAKRISGLRAKTRGTKKKKSTPKRPKSDNSFAVARPARARSTDDDAQGLSNVEIADSESVSELVDEGNAFEAGVVGGVEAADAADEREVETHEVSEDDVPEEYLDQD